MLVYGSQVASDFRCPGNVVVFLLYVQCISHDVSRHLKKNIEQQVIMHLSYPHMLLHILQFVVVNSKLVCMWSHTGSRAKLLTFHRASSSDRTMLVVSCHLFTYVFNAVNTYLGVFGLIFHYWVLVILSQCNILNIVILIMVSFTLYVFCFMHRQWRQQRTSGRCSVL